MRAQESHGNKIQNPDKAPASDRGATAVEYGMIIALIAAVVIATVALVGTDTLNNWDITW